MHIAPKSGINTRYVHEIVESATLDNNSFFLKSGLPEETNELREVVNVVTEKMK